MLKQYGFIRIGNDQNDTVQVAELTEYIKVLFLRAGGIAVIDFREYITDKDTLFFINQSQVFQLPSETEPEGFLFYHNRDFYCVEIHDKEVSCDGILYNNVYDYPAIPLSSNQSDEIQTIMRNISSEIDHPDTASEEMARILLKQIIIRATRLWKTTHHFNEPATHQEVEFLRKFSQLVEKHYKQFHTVSDYANVLHLTPKNLSKKISRFSRQSPNELIKDRIVLEAKRLLAHTTLSIKEIGYSLGYEDDAYFIRLFTKQTGISPLRFRRKYQE